MTLKTFSPGSIEGLVGLWEEQPVSLISFKGLELSYESPLSNGSDSLSHSTAHQKRCKPESMVKTMNPLEGIPRPFQGGKEVRC